MIFHFSSLSQALSLSHFLFSSFHHSFDVVVVAGLFVVLLYIKIDIGTMSKSISILLGSFIAYSKCFYVIYLISPSLIKKIYNSSSATFRVDSRAHRPQWWRWHSSLIYYDDDNDFHFKKHSFHHHHTRARIVVVQFKRSQLVATVWLLVKHSSLS